MNANELKAATIAEAREALPSGGSFGRGDGVFYVRFETQSPDYHPISVVRNFGTEEERDAFFAACEGDPDCQYLQRGRRFASLHPDDLEVRCTRTISKSDRRS